MKIEKMTPKQIKQVYREFMVHDFPDNERKPLSMILKGVKRNQYDCLGMFDCGEIVAYAFFVRHQSDYLFDYLAVCQDYRNHGIGSEFLEYLRQYYMHANSVIGEVENPSYATSMEDKQIQQRRLEFYLRNGYKNTGIEVYVFGVHYLILEMNLNKTHRVSDIKKMYGMHYQRMLPKFVYRKMIHIDDN